MGKGSDSFPMQLYQYFFNQEKADSAEALSAGDWYRKCLLVGNSKPFGGWFGLFDCAWRYSLTVMLFYWNMIVTPLSFFQYTFHYNQLWYGKWGLLLTATYPVLPLAIVMLELCKKIQDWLKPQDNWMTAGPGAVFFVKPSNPIADLLWSCYLNTSMFTAQFLLAGNHPDAISHTWEDTILTKDFWRGALERVGACVPRQLGRWVSGELILEHELDGSDLVIKVPDSYLGIGDSFWNHGRDYTTQEELESLLSKEYPDKEVMVLELVRPKKELGVHSLDILTVRTPKDGARVLSVLLWTNCTTDSSHSCQEGYVIDVETEQIVGACNWYCAAFAEAKSPLVGTKYPGVRKACQSAVAAHNSIKEKWLVAVGWDAMVMEKEKVVFFEGNFAGARTPRRVFLSLKTLVSALWYNFWPFGTDNTVTPYDGMENSKGDLAPKLRATAGRVA